MAVPVDAWEPYLFLSYASPDRDRALATAALLEANGVAVWIDRTGISAGSGWAEEIVAAVRNCTGLVVLCSASAITSRNVLQELQLAWDSNRPIVPVLLDQVELHGAFAYFLQGRQWIDAATARPGEWEESLIGAAQRLGFQAEPPPVRSGGNHLDGIPQTDGPLIGRSRELNALATRLRDGSRLITLTGPGGVGKTRLALEIARQIGPDYRDGAVCVDLTPVADPQLVPSAVAQAFGVRDSSDRSRRESLFIALRDRTMLLLLDNFEHVIDAAPLVGELLAAAPGLHVLITSREALRVRGETEVVVEPLPLPGRDDIGDPERLAQSPTVALFLETARSAKPGFDLTEEHARAVAEICRRLDGLPLAIELAARRIRHFPPDVLLAHLDKRLPVLTGGPRDLPARQQTLCNAIAWSYELLQPDEQAMFRRLGVFVGGATIDAVEAVIPAAGALTLDPLNGLASLVEKSLVRENAGHDGSPRFSMLETIREFALNQLDAAEETAITLDALAAWAMEFSESEGSRDYLFFSGQRSLAHFDEEIDNIRRGFDIALTREDAESCTRLINAVYGYFYLRGLFREAASMTQQCFSLDGIADLSDETRAITLSGLSVMVSMLNRFAEAESYAREALALLEEAGAAEDKIGQACIALLIVLRRQKRYDEARVFAERAYALFDTLPDRRVRLYALYHLGELASLQNDLDGAVGCLTEALTGSLRLGPRETALYSASSLASVYVRRGDLAQAATTSRTAAQLQQKVGSGIAGLLLLHIPASLAALSARPRIAATLFGSEAAQATAAGTLRRGEAWIEEIRSMVREQLGEQEFDAAYRVGEQLTLEEALDLVFDLVDDIEREQGTGPLEQTKSTSNNVSAGEANC